MVNPVQPPRRRRARQRFSRVTLTLALFSSAAGMALITINDEPVASAQPDIPCEQWQQMHPGWPCVPVPKPPPGPPPGTPGGPGGTPTTAQPLPTPAMPGQPPGPGGVGGRPGALTPPPVPPGNGTPIVSVPPDDGPPTESNSTPRQATPPPAPPVREHDSDVPRDSAAHSAPVAVVWPWLRLVSDDGKAPDAVKDCGTLTCTVYFNKATTDFLASGSTTAVGTAVCAGMGLATGGAGAVICSTIAAPISVEANWAKAHGNCAKIKYTRVPPPGMGGTWWPDTYSGGNCQ